MSDLISALQEEIKRVREVIRPRYVEIGPSGRAAIFIMDAEVGRAERSIRESDTVQMIRSLGALREYKD